MAVTVSGKNLNVVDDCEDDTNWSGASFTQDGDTKKEGTYSLCCILKSSGNNDVTYTPGSSIDLSGAKHLRIWFLSTHGGLMNTLSSGGVQLWVSDGSNTGYYYVSGKDVYSGGWTNLVVDVSRTVDAGTKPSAMNVITSLGFRLNLTGAGKNAINTWFDNFTVCDGLIAYGDDGGGYFDFEDIYSADDTSNGIGIITKIGGVYFLTGSIEFGDASGSSGCKFQAKSQTVVFEDRKVNSNLYNFTVVDNGTGTTEFILGSKSGTSGVEGCTIRIADLAQTPVFDIDGGTDADISDFKLYGSTILGGDSISFPSNGANIEVLNCNFERCGEIDVDTCTVTNSNFVGATGTTVGAIMLDSTSHNVTKCNFIGNSRAIRFPSGSQGSYTFTSLLFNNNTLDIRNEVASGQTVTINCGGTPKSDPTTSEEPNGGTTSIVNTVTLTITCKNESGLAVEGVRVRIEKVSDGSLISEGTTNSSGVYQDSTYTYVGDIPVYIIARLKGYRNNKASDTITTSGLSVPFTMLKDPAVDLP